MKKIVFVTIISCLFLASCGGGKKQNSEESNQTAATAAATVDNDLKKERISGSVDSLRQRLYWCLEKFGRMEKGKLQNWEQHDFLKVFDNDGFLTEEIHYTADNKITSRRKITYNNSHQLLAEEIFKGDDLTERTVYTYNANNKLAAKEKFGKDEKLKEKIEYSYYEDSGLLMDEDWYKSDGTLSLKYVHLYEDNLLSERQKYWGGGSLAQKEYYVYDNNENLIFYTSNKYQNKTLIFDKQIRYSGYDKSGDYYEKMIFNEAGNENEKTTYVYDVSGYLTEYLNYEKKRYEPAETVTDETENTDDEETETDEISVEETSSDLSAADEWWQIKSGEAYTYENDDNGNWIQKITYKINSENERTRQYYFERKYHYR
ncbi:MAG: hypothetical protein LBT56_07340 [Prevotellaceae bacterium]|jgi:hypothetical protein|nr:hypothetical protein [Prevotellaceae bacterium]